MHIKTEKSKTRKKSTSGKARAKPTSRDRLENYELYSEDLSDIYVMVLLYYDKLALISGLLV